MRIIGGKYRGKKLNIPADNTIRPTTDRMRETLFNILEHGNGPGIRGSNVLDLYAGTGALGIEALSRYAEHVCFVDNNFKSMKLIKDNCEFIDNPENVSFISIDGSKMNNRGSIFDIIFIDPPYHKDLIAPTLENIILQKLISSDGIAVIEYARDEVINIPDCYTEMKKKKIGEATFSILQFTH